MTCAGPRLLAVAMLVVAALSAVGLMSVSSAASKSPIALRAVASTAGTVVAGGKVRLKGKVRNRSGRSRAGRLVVRMRPARGRAKGLVVARRRLARLRPGRTRAFRIVFATPRSLEPRRYRLIACVRSGRARPSCRRTRRPLRVIRRGAGGSPGPGSPSDPAPGGSTPSETPQGTVFQTIHGFGVSERPFSDPHIFGVQGAAPAMTEEQRDAVLDALFVELGLTRVRPVQPDTAANIGIEPTNDNADPFATDLSDFNFSGRRLDDHAEIVAETKQRGATTAWNSPLNRESWMGVSAGTPDVAEYAEWLLAQVRRFREQGARLDYVSIANEPSYTRNTMSGAFIRDVIKNLGPRLQAENLQVPFAIPDDVRSSAAAAKASTVLADPAARQYVGALATHLYDEPLDRLAALRSLAREHDLPLWMTESSVGAMNSMRPSGSPPATPLDWALLVHELLATYDVGAVDHFWGYSGADNAELSSLIQLRHDRESKAYLGFTRLKPFYYLGQFSRFVRPGALRVSVTSDDPAVRATAYFRGRDRTIVAINPTAGQVTANLTAPDLSGVEAMSRTRTSQTENWATLPSVPVSGTSVTLVLPPRSVTTLNGTKG